MPMATPNNSARLLRAIGRPMPGSEASRVVWSLRVVRDHNSVPAEGGSVLVDHRRSGGQALLHTRRWVRARTARPFVEWRGGGGAVTVSVHAAPETGITRGEIATTEDQNTGGCRGRRRSRHNGGCDGGLRHCAGQPDGPDHQRRSPDADDLFVHFPAQTWRCGKHHYADDPCGTTHNG
jgi:hypothetical protein